MSSNRIENCVTGRKSISTMNEEKEKGNGINTQMEMIFRRENREKVSHIDARQQNASH